MEKAGKSQKQSKRNLNASGDAMHWVKATQPENKEPVWVNLAAIQTMVRIPDRTVLYLGGMAVTHESDPNTGATKPRPLWARTDVVETPDELFAMAKIEPGLVLRAPVVADPAKPLPAGKAPTAAPLPPHLDMSQKRVGARPRGRRA